MECVEGVEVGIGVLENMVGCLWSSWGLIEKQRLRKDWMV